jgi:hypothetical protein
MTDRRDFLKLGLAGLAALGLEGATLAQVRLGVTSDEIDEDVAVAAKFLHDFGLGFAEIRSIWGKYNTSQPLEKIREAKALLAAQKVQTSILGTPFFRGQLPAGQEQAAHVRVPDEAGYGGNGEGTGAGL